MILTLEKTKKLFESLPFKRSVVGLAVHPSVEVALRKDYLDNTFGNITDLCKLPIIIDNRLTPEVSEAYYDSALWKKRVEEQQKHDENIH